MILIRVVHTFWIIFFLTPVILAAQDLNDAIIKLGGDPSLKNGAMSFTIFDRKTEQLIATHNPNVSLIPASSLKILTCAYGLKTLGKNFKFKTTIETTGEIDKNGVLHGDLILKGYGDPTLGSDLSNDSGELDKVLKIFATEVKSAGIKSIEGRIYGDGSYLSDEGIYNSWLWGDIGNYYAAGVYGLNIYDNLFRLKFKQSKQGTYPKVIGTYPNIPGLQFASQVLCAGANTGDNAYIFGGPLQYNRQVKGTIPAGNGIFEIKGSMPDPPLMAALLLKDALTEAGITSNGVGGSLKDVQPVGKRKVLYTHSSKSLDLIVNETILKSININAEGILRYCKSTDKVASTTDDAVKTFGAFLQKTTEGQTGFFVCDGSGLSTSNSLPSYGFAKVLLQLFKDPSIADVITDALPVAGMTGTLKNYLKGSKAAGHIKAKTGSMDKVRSFSGIITGDSGKEYVFSLIINNYNCSSAQIKAKIESFFNDVYLAI